MLAHWRPQWALSSSQSELDLNKLTLGVHRSLNNISIVKTPIQK